ncbi:integrase [Methylobacterium currus]|uniref:Integrase n=1 Tax=Methylobacterium currus TaxID=2051553 RepID=A0A2R4WMC1_9HYPH|nr:integrase [Methylobacterium currus]AWB22680.1 integrase [Methylobacterium currus]
MSSEFPTPGLKRKARKGGPDVPMWAARADLVKRGYEPKTVRLPYRLDEPDDAPLLSAACLRLQAEMLEWSSGHLRDPNRFDGTIRSLSRRYQTDPESPFNRRLKHTTREKDAHVLTLIEKAFGDRLVPSLKLADFWRWYDAAKKPKATGQPERVRRAWGIMKKLRELFAYGVAAELDGCARVRDILAEIRFPQPARRRVTLDLEHIEAFIPKAIEMGRISLALATAIQFDAVMRQKDVVGEWEPIPEGEALTGIVLNGRRWVNGLTWAGVVLDGVTRKATTKTGAMIAHDFSLCPHVQQVAAHVLPERRVGPLIVDEQQGRPYAGDAFQREWRKVARAAGIPDHIWNMDARAGAITEAEDAGADLDAIRATAAHTDAKTTARYSRGAVGKSRTVAELRLAHRAVKNSA